MDEFIFLKGEFMKKQMKYIGAVFMAGVLAAILLVAGCAPAKKDDATSSGTSFFPNVTL